MIIIYDNEYQENVLPTSGFTFVIHTKLKKKKISLPPFIYFQQKSHYICMVLQRKQFTVRIIWLFSIY